MTALPASLLARLDQLIDLGDRIAPRRGDAVYADSAQFMPWRAASIAFMERVVGARDAYTENFREVTKRSSMTTARSGTAILRELRVDLNGGYLDTMSALIAADLVADVWDQAAELLEAGYKDAAAAICGVALESGLRQVAQLNHINVDDIRGIHDLSIALNAEEVINAVKLRQIDAWRELRNAAAHGEYDTYSAEEVRLMSDGVRTFLSDLLG